MYIFNEAYLCNILLDISQRANDPDKLIAYLDGPDARLFRILKQKLGSEERVKNAFILTGMIAKLSREGVSYKLEVERIKRRFPELVGLSYESFDSLIDSI